MKKTRLAVLMSCSLITLAAHSAQYRVVELPVSDLGQSAFASGINGSGDVIVNVQNLYSPVIDVSLIDFELESLVNALTDIEAAKAGNLNDEDYLLLYSFVNANRENQGFQQIAQRKSFVFNETVATLLPGFDLKTVTDGVFDGSTTTIVRGLNDFGYAVGASQGGFYKLPYTFNDETEATFVLNDFYRRGFAEVNGKVVELAPPDITAGGLSDAFDINSNNQVVGTGTTAIESETFQTSAANCVDETLYPDPENPDDPPAKKRGDLPVESCLRSLNIALSTNPGAYAQRRGLIWQLDDQGALLSTKELGLLFSPEEDDSRIFNSTAVAINDNGIAVGDSPVLYKETTALTTGAAIYIGDQILTINANDDNLSSTATAINDDDIVVGYVQKRVNGIVRKKFFVHDINTDITTYPNDFFLGSSSVPSGINNNGLVVGYAEIEASINNRRNAAFLYNYEDNSFTDIGSLLACDSPYVVQTANGINDNNEIAATALRKGKSTNIKGEPVLDSDGVEIETDVVVAVKLIPIEGGSVEQCEVVDEVNRPRQGAGMSGLLLLAFFGIGLRGLTKKA